MSITTGNGSPNDKEPPVQSQESQLKESLPSKVDPVSKQLLRLTPGPQSDFKSAASETLVKIAEETSDQPLSEASKSIISKFVEQSSRGFAGSMPMRCAGPRCPFINACPLSAAGSKLPIGSPCPVEHTIVATWVSKHLKALGIEDINDPMHSFDMDMLYELAGQELIRWRCSVHLSDTPDLVTNQQVGGTMHGEQLFADIINPVLEVMEKAGRNIAKIREALVATRAAQITAGQDILDPTQKASDLKRRAHELAARRRERRITPELVKDAEYEVKENKDENI